MSVDLARFFIFAGILLALPLIALTVPAFRPYLRKNPVITFLLGISTDVTCGDNDILACEDGY